MSHLKRLITLVVVAVGGIATVASPASAGGGGSEVFFTPDPVVAGASTTASGNCFFEGEAVPVTASFTLRIELADGTFTEVPVEFSVNGEGAYSGSIPIPATAVTQTVRPSTATCVDAEGFPTFVIFGELAINAATPPSTTIAPTTTAAPTTTIAPTTTAAPTTAPTTTAATAGPGTLPATGADTSTALIGVAALAAGVGFILLSRRRPADA